MDQLFVNVPSSIDAPPQTPLPLVSHPTQSWNTVLDHDDFDDDPPKKEDKHIRRRSSKACDQCRKSKCKCERPGSQDEPCKNCVLLGTPCTFLGPSRKRGPPKGYIDAIESRLHQMEALLGTLLATSDSRARSLLADLSGDPLARDILARVDESPFGTRPKHRPTDPALEDRPARILRTSPAPAPAPAFPFPSPTTEWQLHLQQRLRAGAPRLPRLHTTDIARPRSDDATSESPRQRRRLTASPPSPSRSRSHSPLSSSSDDEELASAVGQLSLNEDSQVRYHGKVSGLHILGQSDRLDKRNEGGIWRFPRAGVWPRAAPHNDDDPDPEPAARAHFPPAPAQEELLALYFAYVHPVLPLMQQAQFWRDFRGEPDPSSPRDDHRDPDTAPPQHPGEPRVPVLLLLAMFAVAARYRPPPAPPADGDMWSAGDEFLALAKRILNQTYASSRPSTCQALLLLSYREVGIGAMAQAWLYVGMAVRMAQDLGMHRSAEKWQRTGAELFTPAERQLRKRIWFACVVMDKYVSTYIGRPLSIFERDFDTQYPSEDPAEELALWTPHPSGAPPPKSAYVPAPTRLISCFNASARLSSLLSNIVETIYAVHVPPTHSRHAAAALLEKRLDRWFLDLPPHLTLSAAGAGEGVPPPHVFTLHMQYWCAVLLLHRPFMRRKLHLTPHTGQTAQDAEAEATASCRKAFDLCAMAATKISNTVSKYKDHFSLQRSAAFLTYYIFSASIMHMTTLSVRPIDIQAGLGLQRCMDALQQMHIVWPSAGRAWELVHGAKIDMREVELSRQAQRREKRKAGEMDYTTELVSFVDHLGPSANGTGHAHGTTMWPIPHPDPMQDSVFGYSPDMAELQGDVLLSQLAFSPKADLWEGFVQGGAGVGVGVGVGVGGEGGEGAGLMYGLPMPMPVGMGMVEGFVGGEFGVYDNGNRHVFQAGPGSQ